MSRRAKDPSSAEPMDAADPDHPRRSLTLVGQGAAEAVFARALGGGRAAGSWLLIGPPGIGKATLAYRIARRVLAAEAVGEGGGLFGDPQTTPAPAGLDSDPEDPGVRKVIAGSHPDLLTIEPDRNAKRAAELGVDDIRRIGPFLHLTPALGRWRVVIVDQADGMNRNAANALLKLLEEPPDRALVLLVASRAGLLPATVRSRCRLLRLTGLEAMAVATVLGRCRPDLPAQGVGTLAALADGSPGRALELADHDGATLWGEVQSRLAEAPTLDWAGVDTLADKLGAAAAEHRYRLWSELYLSALGRIVRAAAAPRDAEPSFARLAAAASLDRWIELWEKTATLWERTRAANMDRRQAVLGAFALLERATAGAQPTGGGTGPR